MTYRVNVILYIEHDKLLLRYRRAKSQEWPKHPGEESGESMVLLTPDMKICYKVINNYEHVISSEIAQ